jgi:hypothetical protein
MVNSGMRREMSSWRLRGFSNLYGICKNVTRVYVYQILLLQAWNIALKGMYDCMMYK